MALDTALLSPRFVGKKIGLHPVWMIFALYSFSYVFGFVGTLIAVPVAAAIGVIVRFALTRYLASEIYQGPPAGELTADGRPATALAGVDGHVAADAAR